MYKNNLRFLKTDPKARYQGYLYYFREGFCWTNVLNPNARLLKAKLKAKSVNDVGSMSLSSVVKQLPNSFFITALNSDLLFDYYREFINATVNIQINDIRQLPIVIPTEGAVNETNSLFEQIINLKKRGDNTHQMKKIEKELNNNINNLYQIV